MKPPKRSFILSIAVTFVVGYIFANALHFFWSNLSYYDEYNLERSLQVVQKLELGVSLLKHGDAKALGKHLAQSRQARQIDFFLIRKDGKTISFGNVDDDLQGIDVPYVANQIVTNDSGAYGTVAIGDYFLVVGINKNKARYLQAMFEKRKGATLADIFAIAVMMIGIVVFFFRDIRELIEIFRSRDRNRLEGFRPARTSEALVMAQGLKAYEQQARSHRSEEKKLRGQMLASMRTELDSGLKPPYEFRCVMVRTDINQYSTIYSSHPVEEFMAVIDEFFTRSSEVIDRYHGYVTEFIGDEIIFYLKEDEHSNAAAMAMAAIRDIHGIADELNLRTSQAHGYPFRVKSAIACGSLRFGPQVNRLALSGAVFVETVRILSEVEEKSESKAYLPTRIALRTFPVCRSTKKKSVELRGVPGVTDLFSAENFLDCRTVLQNLSVGDAPTLRYFRSDADLLLILRKLTVILDARTLGQNEMKLAEAVIRVVREISAPSSDPALREAYLAIVSVLPTEGKLASAFIMLSTRILSRQLFDERLGKALTDCLSSPDRRILSNAIEALTQFDPNCRNGLLTSLIRHGDNRVMANALIKQGLVALDVEVINALRSMIQSDQPLFNASGAYAIGELARHYRSQDLPFYETHFEFQDLIRQGAELARSADPRVRHQAETLLRKAGIDASLSKSLRVA